MSQFACKHNNCASHKGVAFSSTLTATAFIILSMALPGCSSTNTAQAQTTESIDLARQAANTAAEYFVKNGQLPRDLQIAGFKKHLPESMDSLAIDPADGTIIVRFKSQELAGKALFLTPHISGQNITWTCSSDSLPTEALPAGCGA